MGNYLSTQVDEAARIRKWRENMDLQVNEISRQKDLEFRNHLSEMCQTTIDKIKQHDAKTNTCRHCKRMCKESCSAENVYIWSCQSYYESVIYRGVQNVLVGIKP